MEELIRWKFNQEMIWIVYIVETKTDKAINVIASKGNDKANTTLFYLSLQTMSRIVQQKHW